jgi:hypothetical protein
MTVRNRMHNIGMALFGPAPSGPYGPPVAPPAPRPRDLRGRILRGRKLADFTRLAELARATSISGVEQARLSIESAFDGFPAASA